MLHRVMIYMYNVHVYVYVYTESSLIVWTCMYSCIAYVKKMYMYMYSRESLIRTSVIRTRRLTERAVRATPPLLRSPRVYSVRSNWTHYVLYSICAINPRWLLVLVLRPLERKGRELF